MQFRVALVSAITPADLENLAREAGWDYQPEACLSKVLDQGRVEVKGYWGAFAEIIRACDLVAGMAGTAVEQAVGLGKPVIQLAGQGPQFTYRFADAQMRLLGDSVTTVGSAHRSVTTAEIQRVATVIMEKSHDPAYRQRCGINGQERVGSPGGSRAIARCLASYCSP